MPSFGNRIRNNTHRRGALSPLTIILICAGAALLLAIIIGLFLNVYLDDEAYDRLTKGEQEEEEIKTNKSYTRDVHAEAYVFDDASGVYEVELNLASTDAYVLGMIVALVARVGEQLHSLL